MDINDTATNLIGQRSAQTRNTDINSYSSFRDEFNFIRGNFDREGSIDEEERYYLNDDDDDTKCIIINNSSN